MRNLVLLLLFSFSSYAQTDTTYFNDVWIKITDKEKASFFRIVKPHPSGGYDVNDCYISGVLQMSGHFTSLETEVKDGYFIFYDSTGAVVSKGRYKNNGKDGEWKDYREDGSKRLWCVAMYKDGMLHGKFYSYYKDGKLKRKATYFNGVLRRGKMLAKNGDPLLYTHFLEMPKPPTIVQSYFFKNFVFPKELGHNKFSTMLVIEFTVDTAGQLKNINVLKSVHPLIDAEAKRIFADMPPWRPALTDDKPVELGFRVPILISH